MVLVSFEGRGRASTGYVPDAGRKGTMTGVGERDPEPLNYRAPAREPYSERRAWWGLAITLIVCLLAFFAMFAIAPIVAWLTGGW